MRILLIAIVAALAPAAHAQVGGYGGGLGAPITVETTEVKALGKLPKSARTWMAEEAVRQAERPGNLETIDSDMQAALGEALESGARRLRMDVPDLVATIRYHVLQEAGRLLDEDIRMREEMAAGGTPPDGQMLALQMAVSHRHRIRALEEQAQRRLTRKASAAVAD